MSEHGEGPNPPLLGRHRVGDRSAYRPVIGAHRAQGLAGPPRGYLITVALLAGTASMPLLAAISAESATVGGSALPDGVAPFIPPPSDGPVVVVPQRPTALPAPPVPVPGDPVASTGWRELTGVGGDHSGTRVAPRTAAPVPSARPSGTIRPTPQWPATPRPSPTRTASPDPCPSPTASPSPEPSLPTPTPGPTASAVPTPPELPAVPDAPTPTTPPRGPRTPWPGAAGPSPTTAPTAGTGASLLPVSGPAPVPMPQRSPEPEFRPAPQQF